MSTLDELGDELLVEISDRVSDMEKSRYDEVSFPEEIWITSCPGGWKRAGFRPFKFDCKVSFIILPMPPSSGTKNSCD